MDDFNEQETYDDSAVYIEDLGAPNGNVDFFLFSLGEKIRAAMRFLSVPAALLSMGAVLIFFLPGAALVNQTTQPSQPIRIVSQQKGGCNAPLGNPRGAVWRTNPSVPGSSRFVIVYVCGHQRVVGVGKP